MFKNRLLGVIVPFAFVGLAACSSGELRAFNDAMASANGYDVYYHDQSDVEWIGDIRWETGVRGGEGYSKIKNTGSDYCRVRLRFEDGSYKYYNLDPGESQSLWVSLYNQDDYMNTLCNRTSAVYNESF